MSQRHNTPQERKAPILPAFCSFVEILYVQNNLACYGLGTLACGSLHTAVAFVPNG
jgi:hypothetical protein